MRDQHRAGTPRRELLHVDDLARAHACICWNISTGRPMSAWETGIDHTIGESPNGHSGETRSGSTNQLNTTQTAECFGATGRQDGISIALRDQAFDGVVSRARGNSSAMRLTSSSGTSCVTAASGVCAHFAGLRRNFLHNCNHRVGATVNRCRGQFGQCRGCGARLRGYHLTFAGPLCRLAAQRLHGPVVGNMPNCALGSVVEPSRSTSPATRAPAVQNLADVEATSGRLSATNYVGNEEPMHRLDS